MSLAFYNEFDRDAAAWLRDLIAQGLIPPGVVDERSIAEIRPADLRGFTQVHFFAGIGGWALAARLAGWPDDRPLWTGSCPCQPYSVAGDGEGDADPRNLWPEFRRLIRACRPLVLVGEQVAAAIGHGWLDGVRADLARAGYASRAAVVPACAVGAPHRRDRLWFVAADRRVEHAAVAVEHPDRALACEAGPVGAVQQLRALCHRADGAGPLEHAHGESLGGRHQLRRGAAGSGAAASAGALDLDDAGLRGRALAHAGREGCDLQRRAAGLEAAPRLGRGQPAHGGGALADSLHDGAGKGPGAVPGAGRAASRAARRRSAAEPGHGGQAVAHPGGAGSPDAEQPGRGLAPGAAADLGQAAAERGALRAWDGAVWLPGADGKLRRVEPGIRLLAHGVSGRMALERTGPGGEVETRHYARVAALRGFGNAIVPQLGAQVIGALIDCLEA